MLQKVNFSIIKEIQDKADIVAVISNFIKLTRKGNNYVGICPFHADKNPSLVVSPKKKIFKCFVCNTKGNVFGFVQQYKKVPFIEAVRMVAKLIGYDDSALNINDSGTYLDPKIKRMIDANKQVNEWYRGFLFNPENQDKIDYLNKRGIDNDIIKTFEFGYAPNSKDLIYRMASNADEMFGTNRGKELIWNEKELSDSGLIVITQEGKIFDFFNDRIMIPIYDNNGYLVAFSGRTTRQGVEPKYLNTSTTKLFSKSNVLFNFHRAKMHDSNKIIVVEGFMDAIAYTRAGYPNVVATMGVALTNEHLNALSTLTKLDTVILSFDNDDAGVMATVTNGQKLMENGFNTFVVGPYNKSIKDVDELINKNGKEAIDNILQDRVDFVTFYINNEFTTKKPLDEIQKSVNMVIKHMVDFGDNSLLLRQQHLKLLSEKSGLAFEDLKSKFDQDINKLNVTDKPAYNSSYTPRPYKPTNDFGLDKKFIEPEVNQKDVIPEKAEANKMIAESESKIKTLRKTLSVAYDRLIMTIIANPSLVSKVVEELSINSEFDLTQQKLILKGILYLHTKTETINDENLNNFLKSHSESKNDIAKDYGLALKYFNELLSDQFNTSYFRNKLSNKAEERLNAIVIQIQQTKYELLIANKIIKIWHLSKETNVDQTQIDKLNLQINTINDAFIEWMKKRKK
ncbi:MAG: DNA primase [Mycoplasmataceae bacterium]|nr:DNA primase [Mycoplasmataceae bacterium]